MSRPEWNCPCGATHRRGGTTLREFGLLRDVCPALRDVLVPDAVWDEYLNSSGEPGDEIPDDSLLLLAFERGYLSKFTSPVHSLMLAGDRVRDDMCPSYVGALKELWWKPQTASERHATEKAYRGKVAELQLAQHLLERGWSISMMEAWGGDHDIEGRREGEHVVIEVKTMGESRRAAQAVEAAYRGERGDSWSDRPALANSVLSLAYRAAVQLAEGPGVRVAAIVFTHNRWIEARSVVATDRFIDWDSPRFLECADSSSWRTQLESLRASPKHRHIENDLEERIKSLDEVWLIRVDHEFNYVFERTISPLTGTDIKGAQSNAP